MRSFRRARSTARAAPSARRHVGTIRPAVRSRWCSTAVLDVGRLYVEAWSVYESACHQGQGRSTYGLRGAIAIRQPSINACELAHSIRTVRAEACDERL